MLRIDYALRSNIKVVEEQFKEIIQKYKEIKN
jgi:hypothetical protein